jgi:hypothetical protein
MNAEIFKPEEIDLTQYDKIIVAFSGGKDSTACFLHLVDQGVPTEKIELWHHDIDGRGPLFMDWESTPSYCRAFAKVNAAKKVKPAPGTRFSKPIAPITGTVKVVGTSTGSVRYATGKNRTSGRSLKNIGFGRTRPITWASVGFRVNFAFSETRTSSPAPSRSVPTRAPESRRTKKNSRRRSNVKTVWSTISRQEPRTRWTTRRSPWRCLKITTNRSLPTTGFFPPAPSGKVAARTDRKNILPKL